MNEKLLKTQHWKKLPISKEEDYYYKFVSNGNSYTLVITDLIKVYRNDSNEEKIEKEMKVRKKKKLFLLLDLLSKNINVNL